VLTHHAESPLFSRNKFYIVAKLGRKVASVGKKYTKSNTIIIEIQKYIAPLKIDCIGTSGAIILTVYTFTPTGGVITPVSQSKTTITPNTIRLNPTASSKGRIIGTISNIKGKESMKKPPMKNTTEMKNIRAPVDKWYISTRATSLKGRVDRAIKCPKTTDPVMMNNIIQAACKPPLVAWRNACHDRFRRAKPIIKVPTQPIAPP
jgi:hypothetical protein